MRKNNEIDYEVMLRIYPLPRNWVKYLYCKVYGHNWEYTVNSDGGINFHGKRHGFIRICRYCVTEDIVCYDVDFDMEEVCINK